MSDLNLINIDAESLFSLIKTAYYDEKKDTLQIGSDEFALSSVFVYIWSVLLNNINEFTQNRYIDTAIDGYLDALAANYGLESRPDGYHSSANFSIIYAGTIIPGQYAVIIPAESIVVKDEIGNKFTNKYQIKITTKPQTVVLHAVNAGKQYNGIPAGNINIIEDGELYISDAVNTTMTDGGTDGFENDDDYRVWLKRYIREKAGAGTAMAYEARAYNADSRVWDVYILGQNDYGYQKGYVKIYIQTDPQTDIGDQVKSIVYDACNDDAFRQIGDYIVVNYAGLHDLDITNTIQITYPLKFQGIAEDRTTRIINKYKEYLTKKINRPFRFAELCDLLLKKDADGVYALDVKPLDIEYNQYLSAIYPDIGEVINLQSVSTQTLFDGRNLNPGEN